MATLSTTEEKTKLTHVKKSRSGHNMNLQETISKAVKENIPPYVIYFALQNEPEFLGLSESVEITDDIIKMIKVGYQIAEPSEEDKALVKELLQEEDKSVYSTVLSFYLKIFFEDDTQERTNNVFFYLLDNHE
jgi:hypothetical protein